MAAASIKLTGWALLGPSADGSSTLLLLVPVQMLPFSVPPTDSLVHSFIHSFVRSFVRSSSISLIHTYPFHCSPFRSLSIALPHRTPSQPIRYCCFCCCCSNAFGCATRLSSHIDTVSTAAALISHSCVSAAAIFPAVTAEPPWPSNVSAIARLCGDAPSRPERRRALMESGSSLPSASAGPSRLQYVLQSVSSTDPSHSSLTAPHGWQSARGCSYPQSLLLWLGCLCEVRKVQLLSHQSKIARTVELYAASRKQQQQQQQTGRDGRADGVEWSRLGFFSLDANEKSAYKARELKVTPHSHPARLTHTQTDIHRQTHRHTYALACIVYSHSPSLLTFALCVCLFVNLLQSVPLSCQCEWLRIVLKACHVNPLNADGQVGIVALHVMGQPLSQPAAHFTASGQSAAAPSSLSSLSPSPLSTVAAAGELDVSTLQYLSHLHQLKAAAIDAEDFDAAKQMKARIDRLQSAIPSIVECERRKRDAIAREDYDEAKQCKKEADRLREAALRDRPAAAAAEAAEERKEDRMEPMSQRGKRRESRHVVDMDEPVQQQPQQSSAANPLLDDDRPIRPAKQSSNGGSTAVAADDKAVDTRQARGRDSHPPASNEEDKSERHLDGAQRPAGH